MNQLIAPPQAGVPQNPVQFFQNIQNHNIPVDDRMDLLAVALIEGYNQIQVEKEKKQELKREVKQLRNEILEMKTEQEKEKYIQSLRDLDSKIMKGFIAAAGISALIDPLTIPAGTLMCGFVYSYCNSFTSSDLAYLEECERDYMNNHPGCLKSEAFDYAKKKLEIVHAEMAKNNESYD